MQNLKWFFLLFLYGFTDLSIAYTPKEGNVTANLGPFIYKTNFHGSDSGIQSPIHTGTALLVNGDINENGALEIGMFYMDKFFFREKEGKYLAENTNLIHITMGYRRFLTSKLSTSLSLFSSYSIGDPHIYRSEFPAGQDVDTSARDITEYGLDLAVQLEVWEMERFSVVSDLRYAHSVTNKRDERGDHYGAFVSLRYFVQDKEGTYKKEPNTKKP